MVPLLRKGRYLFTYIRIILFDKELYLVQVINICLILAFEKDLGCLMRNFLSHSKDFGLSLGSLSSKSE